MLRKGGNSGFNAVVEAIYKLNVVFFALKKHREKLQTQGISLNLSVATLNIPWLK